MSRRSLARGFHLFSARGLWMYDKLPSARSPEYSEGVFLNDLSDGSDQASSTSSTTKSVRLQSLHRPAEEPRRLLRTGQIVWSFAADLKIRATQKQRYTRDGGRAWRLVVASPYQAMTLHGCIRLQHVSVHGTTSSVTPRTMRELKNRLRNPNMR